MSVRKTRNDRDFWFCPLDPTVEHAVLDEYGNEPGEVIPHYEDAVAFHANISPASGYAQTELFGNLDSYDRVIVTRDMGCGINEHSVLFVEKEPEYTEIQTHQISAGTGQNGSDEIVTVTYMQPKNDYIVHRVARGLNSVSVAIRKVDVG